MATYPIKWNPFGVQLELTVKTDDIKRISEDKYTVRLFVKWKGTWSDTNYGMKVETGGKVIGIPYFNGDKIQEDSGYITGTYSISGAGQQKKTISVKFTNYKDDTADKPSKTYTVQHDVTVPEYIGDFSTGSVSIQDNYNNTFTITATKGTGTNHPTTGTVKYSYDSASYSNTLTSGNTAASYTKLVGLDIKTPSESKRKVYVQLTTTSTRQLLDPNKTSAGYAYKSKTESAEIKQYVAPSSPGIPTLTESSYKNGRLTIKQPWTFLWVPATKANDSSPVKGYRLRLYQKKKGSSAFTNIPIKKADGTNLSYYEANGNDYYYDTDSTNNSLTIEPVIHSFEAGDELYLTVFAYTKLGQNNDGVGKLFSGSGSTAVSSKTYTVQNAGVVNVKTASGWKEGQVYVKTASGWKEATSVQVKTSAGWKEST